MNQMIKPEGTNEYVVYKLRVTIGMLDGSEMDGTLLEFSPGEESYHLYMEPSESEESTDSEAFGQILQVKRRQIAFFGFHRTNDTSNEIITPNGARALTLHIKGNRAFWIKTLLPLNDSSLRFSGFPLSMPTSTYSHYYFYSSSIRQCERSESLGDLLRKDKSITTGELHQGLALQAEYRELRIGELLREKEKVSTAEVERIVTVQKRRKMRLGALLVEARLITNDELAQALEEQREKKNRRLGEILVETGIIEDHILYRTLADKFYFKFVDLDTIQIDPTSSKDIPANWMERYQFFPISQTENEIEIAISDPTNWNVKDILRFQLGKEVKEVVALPSQIEAYIQNLLGVEDIPETLATEELSDLLVEVAEYELQEKEKQLETEEVTVQDIVVMSPDDSPIAKLANQIIIDAYASSASDIHIEPNGGEDLCRIRFRIDGKCSLYDELPSNIWRKIVTRYKVMSKLDIAEKRVPQDGKIRLQLEDRVLELRVATLPTTNQNEDVVMRLLAASEPLPLEKLGLTARNDRELRRLVSMPYGLILCVGPTGSGKTTTLHSLLGSINSLDRKIWTAEDPVEISQKGLRQVQINKRAGMTFAKAMKAFLRADPDVIMVGEMRDHETAHIGIEASLTGHLVYSTLHTNSAPETITRLLDMGLDPFSFADAMLAILAQRLARRLCSSCKESYHPNEMEFKHMVKRFGGMEQWAKQELPTYNEDMLLWRVSGCKECRGSGYRGRVGLHELLVGDHHEMREAIQKKLPIAHLRELAIQNGMTTLLQDGIMKVLKGVTDLKQVLAVCQV